MKRPKRDPRLTEMRRELTRCIRQAEAQMLAMRHTAIASAYEAIACTHSDLDFEIKAEVDHIRHAGTYYGLALNASDRLERLKRELRQFNRYQRAIRDMQRCQQIAFAGLPR